MNSPTRQRLRPGDLRETFASNVKALMEAVYKEEANKPLRLAEASGVSRTTIRRVLAAETGATLETVEALAAALGATPLYLLSESFVAEFSEGTQPISRYLSGRAKIGERVGWVYEHASPKYRALIDAAVETAQRDIAEKGAALKKG